MKNDRYKLPSRGKWIFARAAFYRAQGMGSVPAMVEAGRDWDEGRPCAKWDYRKYAK